MRTWPRRDFLFGLAATLPAALSCGGRGRIPLGEFAPRSMLRVPETEVTTATFPAIDFHRSEGLFLRLSQPLEYTPVEFN